MSFKLCEMSEQVKNLNKNRTEVDISFK